MPFWADWTLILSSQDTAQKPASSLNRFFKISERGSTIGREVRGGVVTFFAMAYILVVNAAILGVAAPKDISQSSIAAGTALVACVMTLLMGLVANFPLAVASGMGLNAVVAFTLANLLGGRCDYHPGADRFPRSRVQGGSCPAENRD